MSKSSPMGLDFIGASDENVPFPILDTNGANGTEQMSFVNPFISSGEDGQNYAIFEELQTLPTPSQKKMMAEELFSNWEVLYFFLTTDKEAVKHYLDLLAGKYKGHNIGTVPRHKVMILLSQYLPTRVRGLMTFLEQKIDTALEQKGASIILEQTSESESLFGIALSAAQTALTVAPGHPTRAEFLTVDEPSSLRRLLYLWRLAFFFLTIEAKKKTAEDEFEAQRKTVQVKQEALASLKRVFDNWLLK